LPKVFKYVTMNDAHYYLPVNWIDGMKINKSHFIQQQHSMLQQLSFATGASINDINYGILPPVASVHKPLRLQIQLDNQQQVTVKLLHCRAVTPGGFVISTNQQTTADGVTIQETIPGLSVPFSELKGKATAMYVVVTINPFTRVAVGNADENELPPRIPFTIPLYSLSLLADESFADQKAGLYQLVVGKIFIRENEIELDENYIPPCVSTASHPELLDIFAAMEDFMGKMELYSIQIIQKIILKKQQNELALIVQKICENILQFTGSHAMVYRWSMLHQPPLHMLAVMASLARLIKNTLDQYLGAGKEELMNYFTEWCEVKQGELEALIISLTNHRYVHENINGTVEKTVLFTKAISLLFANLSRLDYIGKKKDANIFVKEEMVKSDFPDISIKKRRSFLAD
jgi:hypothetical protein